MTDVELQLLPVKHPLAPVGTISGNTRHGLLVRLTGRNGASGWGEATPLPMPVSVGADSPSMGGQLPWEESWSQQIREQVPSALPLSPEAVAQWVGGIVEAASLPLSWRRALQFGLDTACLHVLVGKRANGKSRSGVWARDLATALRAEPVRTDGVPLSALSPAADLETLRIIAKRAQEVGRRAIKIKVAEQSPGDWQAFVRDLRRLGTETDMAIRLDANGSWSLDVATERLSQLNGTRVEFVEQPVAAGELAALGRTQCPWFADESMADPREVAALLGEGSACAGVVLKPALVGGLFRARELAAVAQRNGMHVVITHAFDGPIARHAARALALSLDQPPLACGLDDEPILTGFLPSESVGIEDLYVG